MIGQKIMHGNVFIFMAKHGLCLLVFTDEIGITAKNNRLPQVWAIPRKKVDLKGPVSLIDHVYLRCTQPGAQIKNRIVVDKQVVEIKVSPAVGCPGASKKKGEVVFFLSCAMHGRALKVHETLWPIAANMTWTSFLHTLCRRTSSKARNIWNQ